MGGALQLNKHTRSKLADLPLRGPLMWRRHGYIIKELAEALGYTVSVDGADLQDLRGGRGVHLSLNAGAGLRGPWSCTVYRGEFPAVQVHPATINNRMPTIGGVRIDAQTPPLLALAPATLQYVYAKCAFDYTIEDQAGRNVVTRIALPPGSVTLMASTQSAAALDDPENGFFHLLIATIGVSGRVLAQPHRRSLAAEFTINVPPVGVLISFV